MTQWKERRVSCPDGMYLISIDYYSISCAIKFYSPEVPTGSCIMVSSPLYVLHSSWMALSLHALAET